MLLRLYRAFELLLKAHLSTAKREATDDFVRVLTGLAMTALAFVFMVFALMLAHAGAIFAFEHFFSRGYGVAIGAVGGTDFAIGATLLLIARAKISAPVLVETRATLTKVAKVFVP